MPVTPTAVRPGYLTVSVDDGHPTDLRTAELLARHGLAATFYIPAHNPERAVMPPNTIKQLAQGFDVGGHTIEHKPLNRVSLSKAWDEITRCKGWLEDLISRPVLAFCYPQGKHNRHLIRLVRRAGYVGARTTLFNLHQEPRNPFCWGVSTHAYSHGWLTQARHAFREGNFAGMRQFIRVHRCARDWEEHFRYALEWVQAHGGIAHLYLHSWEIDAQKEWPKLDRVLRDASQRRDLIRVTNGELFSAVRHATELTQ
jgi:peptidoglycan-N-acetylglucosamine deacetylase